MRGVPADATPPAGYVAHLAPGTAVVMSSAVRRQFLYDTADSQDKSDAGRYAWLLGGVPERPGS
jgi:hypothetical protein